MTLLFVFLNVPWVPGINLAGADFPGSHRSWADAKRPSFGDTLLTSPGCTFPIRTLTKGRFSRHWLSRFPVFLQDLLSYVAVCHEDGGQ